MSCRAAIALAALNPHGFGIGCALNNAANINNRPRMRVDDQAR